MIGNACYQKEDVSALNCVAAAYRPDYQNEDPIFLYPYRVYIPGTGSSGVRVEWNVHVSTGCVLINKNEPRKFNVSGVLLCVFLQ